MPIMTPSRTQRRIGGKLGKFPFKKPTVGIFQRNIFSGIAHPAIFFLLLRIGETVYNDYIIILLLRGKKDCKWRPALFFSEHNFVHFALSMRLQDPPAGGSDTQQMPRTKQTHNRYPPHTQKKKKQTIGLSLMGMGKRGREIAKGGNEKGSLWALQDQTTTT